MITTIGLYLLRNWKLMLPLLSVGTLFYLRELSLSSFLKNGSRYRKKSVYEEDSVEEGKLPVNQPSGLNKHLWYGYCEMDLATLCNHPFFPKVPDEMTLVSKLEISSPPKLQDFYQRVFGYVSPPTTGRYKFAISSEDSSELWLSSDSDWENSRRIVFIGTNKTLARTVRGAFKTYQLQISAEINLVRGQKYYIELLHLQNRQLNRINRVQVAWQTPGSLFFQVIDRSHAVPLLGNALKPVKNIYDNSVPPSKACRHLNISNKYLRKKPVMYGETLHLTKSDESCVYKPSYIFRGRVSENDGIFSEFHPTKAFPHHEFKGREDDVLRPQEPLDEVEAKRTVARYMEHIEKKFPDKFLLRKLENVEKKVDEGRKIERYLIELELLEKHTNRTFHTSEYILVSSNGTMCKPINYQWSQTETIYFVVTARNQTNWLLHFIHNMKRIYQETQDPNIGVVIVEYESSESHLNEVQDELERSNLPHYELITLQGRYSRSQSFNAVIQAIDDPQAIVFLVDLHLEIVSAFVDEIRKHCIKGISVYTPTIFRLNCGCVATNPAGYWETAGVGLVAMYMSDWNRIGGFDLRDDVSTYQWGGEDWALLDKIVGGGLEYERVRCPYVYHYYHSKNGMWSK